MGDIPDAPVEEIEQTAVSTADEEPVSLEVPSSPQQTNQGQPQKAHSMLSLEKALEQIPETLRNEMKEHLRADFREVRRWKGKAP